MGHSEAKSIIEWAKRLAKVNPPTQEDMAISLDGRGLDSDESLEGWLNENEHSEISFS